MERMISKAVYEVVNTRESLHILCMIEEDSFKDCYDRVNTCLDNYTKKEERSWVRCRVNFGYKSIELDFKDNRLLVLPKFKTMDQAMNWIAGLELTHIYWKGKFEGVECKALQYMRSRLVGGKKKDFRVFNKISDRPILEEELAYEV